MRVDLGCGPRKPEGYFGVDRHPWPGVDRVADLSQGIPLGDAVADEVRGHDILEHLPGMILSMNEIWRVLKPGGLADILVPSTDGRGAFQDPTHVSFWNANSFWYYSAGDPHREIFGDAYGIVARFAVEGIWHTQAPHAVVHVHAKLRAVK